MWSRYYISPALKEFSVWKIRNSYNSSQLKFAECLYVPSRKLKTLYRLPPLLQTILEGIIHNPFLSCFRMLVCTLLLKKYDNTSWYKVQMNLWRAKQYKKSDEEISLQFPRKECRISPLKERESSSQKRPDVTSENGSVLTWPRKTHKIMQNKRFKCSWSL